MLGSRANSTDDVCRVWQSVQLPMLPSALGLPMAWQEMQPLLRRGVAFKLRQRMRRTFHRAGMELFHLLDHFRRKILVAHDRHPRRRGMAAAGKLLVNRRVTGAAIGGRDASVDDEAIVIRAGLARRT